MNTTVADNAKEYYEHEDFKGNYLEVLSESYGNNEVIILERIKDICRFNYGCHDITEKEIKAIYEFIDNNMEEFVKDMRGYYVGHDSLESVSFGEQEEQLTGWSYQDALGNSKIYPLKYMQYIFDQADYCVSGEYAYYDLSCSGLHIDLNFDKIEHLITIKTEVTL